MRPMAPEPSASKITSPVPACRVVVEDVFVDPRTVVLTATPVPMFRVSAEASVPMSICPVVPEFMVRSVPAPVARSPAPTKVRSFTSRLVLSITMAPASPPSLMVIAPVVPETTNSDPPVAMAVSQPVPMESAVLVKLPESVTAAILTPAMLQVAVVQAVNVGATESPLIVFVARARGYINGWGNKEAVGCGGNCSCGGVGEGKVHDLACICHAMVVDSPVNAKYRACGHGRAS